MKHLAGTGNRWRTEVQSRSPRTVCTTILQFDAYRGALSAWRYPDMTDHVEYLAGVVQTSIEF